MIYIFSCFRYPFEETDLCWTALVGYGLLMTVSFPPGPGAHGNICLLQEHDSKRGNEYTSAVSHNSSHLSYLYLQKSTGRRDSERFQLSEIEIFYIESSNVRS